MRSRFAFLILPVFAGLLFVACQGESEGQPCDTNAGNSGNDDCQPPLICTTGLTNANSPRCCPQDRTTATTPECSLSSTTLDGSNPTPPEGGADTSMPEAGPEATTDAPVTPDTGMAAETGGGDDASDGAATEGSSSDGPAADAPGE
jgi:hypothetical protein